MSRAATARHLSLIKRHCFIAPHQTSLLHLLLPRCGVVLHRYTCRKLYLPLHQTRRSLSQPYPIGRTVQMAFKHAILRCSVEDLGEQGEATAVCPLRISAMSNEI